jgi:hypothetical protein
MTLSNLGLAAIVLASGVAAGEPPQITLSRPAEQRPGCLAEEMRIRARCSGTCRTRRTSRSP